MSRLGDFSQRLHSGEIGYDFIGRRRRWFVISLILLAVCVGSLGVRQLNFGVEFSGGSVFQFSAPNTTENELRNAVRPVVEKATSEDEVVVQSVSGGRWRVQTSSLAGKDVSAVQDAIAKQTGIQADDVSQEQIGPSWGVQVSQKAGIGLLIFLGACIIFLWAVFDWKMAMAAMLALLHDLLITAGVYSLVGFEVTPATVIGFLTILGYSLYDTVVVFDKVRENTSGILGGNRTTFSRAANLAVNQTLARSINTSVVAVLPVAGILVVSTVFINASTLQDLALALFAGMLAGTYSSIFIASPVLAMLKEREPKMASLRRRVEAREAAQRGEGEKPKRRKAKASTAAKANEETADAADEPADEPGATEGSDGTKVEAKTSSGSTVTVKATSGGASGQQKKAQKRTAQNVGQRGAQRPQPKRGGSNKKKSKGKKKR